MTGWAGPLHETTARRAVTALAEISVSSAQASSQQPRLDDRRGMIEEGAQAHDLGLGQRVSAGRRIRQVGSGMGRIMATKGGQHSWCNSGVIVHGRSGKVQGANIQDKSR